MSVSEFSNRWLNRTFKTIAILLVTLAVLISAMRLLLPYAHHYRVDFQNHINQTFQTDIKIGSLTMGWQKSGPVLIAENVDLINTPSLKASLGRLNVQVDFWSSIRHQKLVTADLTLDDAYVYADSENLLRNRANQLDAEQSKLINNVADLFLLQLNRFSIINSHFTLHEDGVNKEFVLGHLNWLNTGNRHQASGDVIFEGVTSDKLKLLVDLSGTEFKELKGQVYVSANHWNITPWLDKALVVEHENTTSNINFNAWANVQSGLVDRIQIELEDSDVKWLTNDKPQTFKLNGGDIVISKLASGEFTIQSSPLNIAVNEQSWDLLEVDAHLKLGSDVSMYISQIDLAGLAEVTPLFVQNMGESSLLGQLAPSGQVHNFYWRFQDRKHQIAMNFTNVAINYGDGIPGIENLSGEVVLSDDRVAGQIIALDSALDFNKHFLTPIPFVQVSSEFEGYWGGDGFEFNATNVEFISDALDLTAEVGLSIPEEGEPAMSLLANVHRGDAEQASLFYPHLLMGEDLVSYLNSAIIAGEMAQAQVLFNGPFSRFPFPENEGIFVVNAELEKAKFRFDPEWPAISNFSANLNFTNNSMLITARDGQLSGLDVEGVTAEIAELKGEQLLIVDAGIDKQSPENITTLMQVSPLRETVGETLTELVVSKPVSGSFSLSLPLQDVDSAIASGHVSFKDNDLQLNTPSMSFKKVNGELFFENDVIRTENVNVEWLGMPVELAVNAKDELDYYQTLIDINAQWQQQHWQPFVPESLKRYGAGELDWQGLLTLNMHHSGGFSYDLDITSDMENAALSLPEPYNKSIADKVALVANVEGQRNQSTLNITLGEQLTFYGVLDHEAVKFSRSHLVLGDEQMLLPMDGFHITTKLAHADFMQWEPFINDILSNVSGETASSSLIERPERIRGSIANANVLGQTFTNVSFNLVDQKNWWLLHLNAKEARSQIKFYPDALVQGIDIDADFIHLAYEDEPLEQPTDDIESTVEATTVKATPVNKPAFTREQTQSIFDNLPPMRVQCDSCEIGKVDFGEMSFDIKREGEHKISLNNFRAKRGSSKILIDGDWYYEPDVKSQTSFKGTLSVKDLEQEISKLGFVSAIKDSGLKTEFDVNWPSAPHEFSLAQLNGDVNVNIDDGYLADVSDKGARIFSILSLQSLVRKLTLDFRDIFSDGMFYSSIKADVHINEGTLYTDNMRMKGAAGDLTVKGNTELAHGNLDYRMSYKPNLTSSLPVLAWIATLNPVTFLAGVAIDEVFTSQVVSEFNFELTGTVTDPNLKEVNRKSRDVSVGRSTPPQFVENTKEQNDTNKSNLNQTPPTLPTDKQGGFDG